jgi:hypothetical protein
VIEPSAPVVQDVKLILDRNTCRLQIDEGTDNMMVFHVAGGIVFGAHDADPRMASLRCLHEIVQVEGSPRGPGQKHLPITATRS